MEKQIQLDEQEQMILSIKSENQDAFYCEEHGLYLIDKSRESKGCLYCKKVGHPYNS